VVATALNGDDQAPNFDPSDLRIIAPLVREINRAQIDVGFYSNGGWIGDVEHRHCVRLTEQKSEARSRSGTAMCVCAVEIDDNRKSRVQQRVPGVILRFRDSTCPLQVRELRQCV
jgi:hypothetical protein